VGNLARGREAERMSHPVVVTSGLSQDHAVRPDGAYHQWRQIPDLPTPKAACFSEIGSLFCRSSFPVNFHREFAKSARKFGAC
jgi:hypothetical protein